MKDEMRAAHLRIVARVEGMSEVRGKCTGGIIGKYTRVVGVYGLS